MAIERLKSHWAQAIEGARTAAILGYLSLKEVLPASEDGRSPYQQWNSIWKKSRGVLAERDCHDGRPVTLFFPVWGTTALFNKHIESVLAHALYLRGHRVLMAACERALPSCHVDPLGCHTPPPPEDFPVGSGAATACSHCVWQMRRLFQRSPLEYLKLSDYRHAEDLKKAFEMVRGRPLESLVAMRHRDVSIGEHAFASVCRVTGRGTLEDSALHRYLMERHAAASAMVVEQTHRLVEAYRPDRIVLTHGIYVDHGTICETARTLDVPVTVFVRPYRKGTVMLCHGDTYHRALVSEPVGLWQDMVLTAAQEERLFEYVESRRRGSMDSVTYHPSPVEGMTRIAEMLDLPAGVPVVSLFTNVMWDAQIYHSCNAFENMLDWVFQTIEYFSGRPELALVIRIHPAEVKAVKKSLQPVAQEILGRYSPLPANVFLVGPESDISSYDLAEMSTATIVYGTKMGIEIALRGIPVIVAGESFIRGKGFTLDASSAEDYIRILDRLPDIPPMSPEERVRAQRYGYHFYFRRQIDFPFVTEAKKTSAEGIHLQFEDIGALAPGANGTLDRICRGLVTGEEILAE